MVHSNHSQPEATESIYGTSTFQGGEPGNDERLVEEQQLDGFNKLICSWQFGNTTRNTSGNTSGESVKIPVPTIWSVECSLRLHQAAETGASKPASSRNAFDHVSGRYAGDGRI